MLVESGKSRRTTAIERRAIQCSDESNATLARRYKINVKTIAKWKKRSGVENIPPGPRRGISTKLSRDEQLSIVAFSRANQLSLDQSLHELQKRIPHLSRSGLHRCLVRHGLANTANSIRRDEDTSRGTASEPFSNLAATGGRHDNPVDMRRAILEIAGRLFLKYGYDRTSMSSIAAELGGSKSTLWKHFSSKQDLFSAYIDSAIPIFIGEHGDILNADASIKPTIETFCIRYTQTIHEADSLKLYRLIIDSSNRFSDVGRTVMEHVIKIGEAELTTFIGRHMLAGRLRQDDPARACRALMSLCEGSNYHRALLNLEQFTHEMLATEALHAASIFLAAYSPPEPQRQSAGSS